DFGEAVRLLPAAASRERPLVIDALLVGLPSSLAVAFWSIPRGSACFGVPLRGERGGSALAAESSTPALDPLRGLGFSSGSAPLFLLSGLASRLLSWEGWDFADLSARTG